MNEPHAPNAPAVPPSPLPGVTCCVRGCPSPFLVIQREYGRVMVQSKHHGETHSNALTVAQLRYLADVLESPLT